MKKNSIGEPVVSDHPQGLQLEKLARKRPPRGSVTNDVPKGPGWWLADNGDWYPPEALPADPPTSDINPKRHHPGIQRIGDLATSLTTGPAGWYAPKQADIESTDRGYARIQRIRTLAGSLAKACWFLEFVAGLSAMGGIIAGLLVALETTDVNNGTVLVPLYITVHLHVPLGIATGAIAIMTSVFSWAVARGLRLFAEYSAYRVDAPLGGSVEPG